MTGFADVWIPQDAAALREAIAGDLLREDHHHDVKRQLGPAGKGNPDLAVDLASFAVDGGLMFLGADEPRPGSFVEWPIDLAGLAERVDQVARSTVDPPLSVQTRTLETEPGRGFAVIVIPPSPDAPHAVDGVYRGRGDRTNIRLADVQVRAIRDDRRRLERNIDDVLENQIARDPAPHGPVGHLFVVAEPVTRRRGMLLPLFGDRPALRMREWAHASPVVTNFGAQGWMPDWSILMTAQTRADGWALFEGMTGHRERRGTDDGGMLELEVGESGSIRLFCGRGSEAHSARDTIGTEPTQGYEIYEHLVGGLTWRVVELAGRLSREASYLGTWGFGVALVGIAGARSGSFPGRRTGYPPYEAHEYRETAVASAIEAASHPRQVTERLVGRLNRSLNEGRADAIPRFHGEVVAPDRPG